MISNLIKSLFVKPKTLSKRNDVYSKKIDGSWKILKENDEFVFSFNKEGNYIWGCIEKNIPIEEIIFKYKTKYKSSLNDSKKNVNAFILDCKKNKLI